MTWKQDQYSITILIFLYILQGIPLGLCGSIPYILTNRGISYKAQALFSLVFWPFSLKLLWAPIVDGYYSKKFGRRKSWMLPSQYFIGFMMLYLSFNIENLISGSILKLTICCFILNFGAATQDIAVDGWCLTMLSKQNVGWASTCNTVGQTAGYFLGNTVFLALESKEFSNNWIRHFLNFDPQDYGVVTLPRFLYFWGIIFIIVTTLIGLFKSEKQDNDSDGVVETYLTLSKILKKKIVITFIIFTLTSRIGLCAVDSITSLKLIEKGIPKENLALMAIPLTPIQIILPLIISKYTAGPKPMNVWISAYIPRLIFGLLLAYSVYYIDMLPISQVQNLPGSFYILLIITFVASQIPVYATFVSIMAFNAKVSDPEIGGTYMTLLNTVTNLGGNWPSTVALSFVDKLSTFNCINDDGKVAKLPENVSSWDDKNLQNVCIESGNKFETIFDGYYIEVIVTTILGFIWLHFAKPYILKMDSVDKYEWYADGDERRRKDQKAE